MTAPEPLAGMRVCRVPGSRKGCGEMLPLDYFDISVDEGKPLCLWCEQNPGKDKRAEGALQSVWTTN